MSEYPREIKFDNMFTSKSIDLDTFDFPKLRVRAWSNVFESGGSYAIEPVDGSTFTRPVLRVNVERNVPSVRQNLVELVDEWNEAPRENWLRILRADAQEQAAYYAKKVAEFDKVIEEARVSAGRVDRLAAIS